MPRLVFGRDRRAESLQHQVLALQAALAQHAGTAGWWREFKSGMTGTIAGLMLALGLAIGLAIGTYGGAIKGLVELAQTVGLDLTGNGHDAYAAYRNGDAATALRLARPLVAAGDARAQWLVGLIYYRGEGITRDDVEAVKWFRRAADQGDAGAQFYLGLMYCDGHGTPQDYAEAAKWFRLSAQHGNPEAQYNLGVLDMSGKAWEPDYVSAYMWFSLAAAYFPASDSRHDTAVTSRDLAAQQLTRAQIAEAQKRARAWAK
jgi:TPR repeat protein